MDNIDISWWISAIPPRVTADPGGRPCGDDGRTGDSEQVVWALRDRGVDVNPSCGDCRSLLMNYAAKQIPASMTSPRISYRISQHDC